LIVEKYFIFNNLNKYLDYYKKNSNEISRNIIEKVNVHRDSDYYTNVKDSDTTKGNLILVNKYFKLNENYVPENIVDISLQFSYAGNSIVKEVNDHFVEMRNAAKSGKGYNIVVSSSYRGYADQKELYDRRKKDQGEEQADKLAARPGHSEHQLGLALDLDLYKKTYDKFEDTEEYAWLIDNCYKYGFILRYPKDKEDITGYSFESWHYRYVGLTVAKYIHDNKITFDEYYEYFINKGLH
jgi:D-alanyl-D-alanine carboxypeptidase